MDGVDEDEVRENGFRERFMGIYDMKGDANFQAVWI